MLARKISASSGASAGRNGRSARLGCARAISPLPSWQFSLGIIVNASASERFQPTKSIRPLESPRREALSEPLAADVPAQKIQGPRPRGCFGMSAKTFFSVVHKSVTRIRVRIEFVSLAVLDQFGVELRHIFRRWILIIRAEVALQRTVDFRGPLERRRDVASPSAGGVAGIKSHSGFERRIGGCKQVDDTPAHTETDNAEPGGIDEALALKKPHRRVDVVDHSAVAQTLAPRAHVVLAIRSVAMVEIGR